MKILIMTYLLLFLTGCGSAYEKVELGNNMHNKSEIKVILVPMQDFNLKILSKLVLDLEKYHNFNVTSYTTMGANKNMYNKERKQFISNEIAREALYVLKRNGLLPCSKTVVVLTNKDINTSDFTLRYNFSTHFDKACMSIVSTARINPVNYDLPKNDPLVYERLMKLVNKAIGLHYYKYVISTNINSVMYGPIMGPGDLDSVGNWY